MYILAYIKEDFVVLIGVNAFIVYADFYLVPSCHIKQLL